jgi:hypothetical protein
MQRRKRRSLTWTGRPGLTWASGPSQIGGTPQDAALGGGLRFKDLPRY